MEFVLSKIVDSNRCFFLMRQSVVLIRMCYDEIISSIKWNAFFMILGGMYS